MKTIRFPGDSEAREVYDEKARYYIGNLNNLNTSEKSSIVDAINEVVENLENGSGNEVDLSGYVTRDELPTIVNNILTQAKESGEFDGYSPIRGTDYWTESDIAEIKSYVDEAILGGEW